MDFTAPKAIDPIELTVSIPRNDFLIIKEEGLEAPEGNLAVAYTAVMVAIGKAPTPFNVAIRYYRQLFWLEVTEELTFAEVLEKLRVVHKIDTHEMELASAGKQQDMEMSLRKCGITQRVDGLVLHLIPSDFWVSK